MTGPGFPDWLEPMAATLTQERSTGKLRHPRLLDVVTDRAARGVAREAP
jgi:hypothetical protein